jgi:hypothetical protein
VATRLMVAGALVAAAAVASAGAVGKTRPATGNYGWPLKPFDEPHAVRAFFGDPRRERDEVSFHFGIDIQAPGGTPVYAVRAGTVYLHQDGLAVRTRNGAETFGYWHVIPVVREHQFVREHQMLAAVKPIWGHVHFADSVGGRYVNPLRRGGIAPWVDFTSPTVAQITFSKGNRAVGPLHVRGLVNIEADVYDTPPIRMAFPWSGTRVAPAFVRWRVLRGRAAVQPWRVAVDFRYHIDPNARFWDIYAPGTMENRAGRPGNYRYFLAHGWSSAALPNGRYLLRVAAFDTRGNEASSTLPFVVANG